MPTRVLPCFSPRVLVKEAGTRYPKVTCHRCAVPARLPVCLPAKCLLDYWTRHVIHTSRSIITQDRTACPPCPVAPHRLVPAHFTSSFFLSGTTRDLGRAAAAVDIGVGGQREDGPAGVLSTAGGRVFQCH
ncbi:hypothetical protein E2C01_006669 [Portunus trituberculatus]|uniref:Uncharacterized protein n=1 Tax=Portunus trituberculatus TaxID=210409 RepID=A0A5B7CWZ0_PORTR|nr:hypothetical protein [Portunus trituberculatus]